MQLARRSDQIPGVPGIPEERPQASKVVFKEVNLKRERVNLSPVYSTVLHDSNRSTPRVGYVRLTQFSGNAADDMRYAIMDLEAAGVDEYVLDLRSNPGGLVSAGIEVASLWLDGDKTVFNVHGRDGPNLIQTTQNPMPALTHKPLAVLVNEESASAAEILSGEANDGHEPFVCIF